VWLEARADAQVTYCQQTHPSGAYDICEETCGKCSDDCNDSDSKYMIDGEIRDCTWLSLRLEKQEAQCVPGKVSPSDNKKSHGCEPSFCLTIALQIGRIQVVW
jgi:hypothetical protein